MTGQVAIVTGGVSGIGAELTKTLIKRGWKVAALDIPSQKPLAEKLAQEFNENIFVYHQCDVSNYDQQAAAFQKTFDKWGRIDALCANAGIIDKGSIFTLDHKDKSKIPTKPGLLCTDVCWKGTIYGTQLAIHFMRQNPTPGGFIICTGSAIGLHPMGSFPEYGAAKAAINALAVGCGPFLKRKENISMNCVNPGVVATQFVDQHMRDTFGHDSMTPISTIVKGYTDCLDDPSIHGKMFEGSRDRVVEQPGLEYVDGEFSKRTTTIYDPYFKFIHGEYSGLDIVEKRA